MAIKFDKKSDVLIAMADMLPSSDLYEKNVERIKPGNLEVVFDNLVVSRFPRCALRAATKSSSVLRKAANTSTR
jgi:hypothetical protein